jgi:hypothetical protein
MEVAGERMTRGLATYPFSEIVYDLDVRATQFAARVGITDDSLGAGSVRFSVYLDDFLAYRSDVVHAGEPARDVRVEVTGASQLRLIVDDAGDGSLGDYALWGNPRVTVAPEGVDLSANTQVAQAHLDQSAEARARLAADDAALKDRLTRDQALLAERQGTAASSTVVGVLCASTEITFTGATPEKSCESTSANATMPR